MKKKTTKFTHIINDNIHHKEIRLIDKEGTQLGVFPIEKAKEIAKKENLDIILISDKAKPVIGKLVNYGQFKYEARKKTTQKKKAIKNILKEVKLSSKIADGDYQVRLKKGMDFLQKGYKVKLSLFFRGREILHSSLGKNIIKKYISDIEPYGTVASDDLKLTGRHLNVLIVPQKQKKSSKNNEETNHEEKTKNQ